MKSSVPLAVHGLSRLGPGRINIHPNEGFDLGLMTTHYSVQLEEGGDLEVYLLNECPKETLEIDPRLWEKMGKPHKVVLEMEEGSRLRFRPV